MIVVVYVAVVNMIFCYEYKCIMLEHHSSREGHLIHWMFWWSILGDDLLQMSTEGHLVLGMHRLTGQRSEPAGFCL